MFATLCPSCSSLSDAWYTDAMTQTVTPIEEHPAKFSDGIVKQIAVALRRYVPAGGLVVDPFAGIGGIHVFAPEWDTRGIELEPEWAATHPRTQVGTALALPWDDDTVDAVVTSPCYGNRMADQYLGENDTCRTCGGDGLNHGSDWMSKPCALCEGDHYRRDCPDAPEALDGTLGACGRCDGSGIRASSRMTYAVKLGRKVSDGSAAAMQWGPEYRQFHADAWREARRVLPFGGHLMVNISDHIRSELLQGVSIWHAATIARIGFDLVECTGIPTQRYKHGANHDLRPQAEWLMVFRKVSVIKG